MPWKNGLGATTEIAIHPPGAALNDFVWRVSIADVRASGPFSTFPGHDRILVQIEGAPMTLSHDGGDEHRLRLLEPYRFGGELVARCTVDGPAARDFGVIVRRERASADVSVHELSDGARVRTEASLVHVLRGSASVEAGGEEMQVVGGETLVALEVHALVVTATSDGTVLCCVTIGPPRR